MLLWILWQVVVTMLLLWSERYVKLSKLLMSVVFIKLFLCHFDYRSGLTMNIMKCNLRQTFWFLHEITWLFSSYPFIWLLMSVVFIKLFLCHLDYRSGLTMNTVKCILRQTFWFLHEITWLFSSYPFIIICNWIS